MASLVVTEGISPFSTLRASPIPSKTTFLCKSAPMRCCETSPRNKYCTSPTLSIPTKMKYAKTLPVLDKTASFEEFSMVDNPGLETNSAKYKNAVGSTILLSTSSPKITGLPMKSKEKDGPNMVQALDLNMNIVQKFANDREVTTSKKKCCSFSSPNPIHNNCISLKGEKCCTSPFASPPNPSQSGSTRRFILTPKYALSKKRRSNILASNFNKLSIIDSMCQVEKKHMTPKEDNKTVFKAPVFQKFSKERIQNSSAYIRVNLKEQSELIQRQDHTLNEANLLISPTGRPSITSQINSVEVAPPETILINDKILAESFCEDDLSHISSDLSANNDEDEFFLSLPSNLANSHCANVEIDRRTKRRLTTEAHGPTCLKKYNS